MAYLHLMLGHLYEKQNCSASRALELVGERWSLLILRDAIFGGLTRFTQFQKSLGVATNILSKRLEDFVEAGLMQRRQGAAGEPDVYALTPKGLEFKAVIVALTEWGDKWVRQGPIDYRDGTGAGVEIQFRRSSDGRRVAAADVVAALR